MESPSSVQPTRGRCRDRCKDDEAFSTVTAVHLFVSFARVGLFGFGGGPSMIPLIQEEVVSVRKWLTHEAFLDAFALGNTLPGPIATKMSAYVGYKVIGWPGAVAALIGIALPTALLMIALLGLYLRFRSHPSVDGFLGGVRPVVVALLLLVAYEFAPRALGSPGDIQSMWPYWLIAVAAFWLSVRYGVHPAVLIVVGGVLGATLLS